jgi:hypothetical protein
LFNDWCGKKTDSAISLTKKMPNLFFLIPWRTINYKVTQKNPFARFELATKNLSFVVHHAPRHRPIVLGAGCFGRASLHPLAVLTPLRRPPRLRAPGFG